MKNILILTDYFPPFGGPRMAYFVDYLHRNDWKPYVLSIKDMPCGEYFFPIVADIPIVRLEYEKVIPINPKLSIFNRILNFIFIPEKSNEGILSQEIINEIRKEYKYINFDLILTSCSFMLSFFKASNILSRQLNIPWVADLRDIHEQNITKGIQLRGRLRLKRNCLRRNNLLKTASLVTTISEWHSIYLRGKSRKPVYTIYNGYDPDLFYSSTPILSNKFQICYSGSFVDGRDLTIFLDALFLLSTENKINLDKIILQTFGRDPERLSQYDYHYCRKVIRGNNIVPHNQLLEIFNASSILLSLVADANGIMTTKAYEYIASRRPILSIPVADGALKEIIDETNSGLSSGDINEIANFIYNKYCEWETNGFVHNNEFNIKVEKYSRENQSRIQEKLLNKLIE